MCFGKPPTGGGGYGGMGGLGGLGGRPQYGQPGYGQPGYGQPQGEGLLTFPLCSALLAWPLAFGLTWLDFS